MIGRYALLLDFWGHHHDVQSEKGKTQPLIPILEGNGFYAWAPSCALIMGVGPKLFEFKPGKNKDWQLIGNLSAQGIKNISRLAIDPEAQWLAIINSPLAN